MKNNLMRITNYLLYLSFTTLIGTGILLIWKLPPGREGGHGLSLLGWTRHDWGEFHFWVAVVMIILTVLHLVLNWRWLSVIAAKRMKWPIISGIGLGLVIILFFAVFPVTDSNYLEGKSNMENTREQHYQEHD